MPKQNWLLRASSISAFKACPTRFRLAYVEGLKPVEDTDSQRIGTNWHKCLEIATSHPNDACPVCAMRSLERLADPACPICTGSGAVPQDEPIDRVSRWLNHCYAIVPTGKMPDDWATERAILAYSLAGWLWYYQDDQVDTVAREVHFELPLRNPATGRALPNVVRSGTIDRICKRGGRLLLGEYKSTSKPIDSGSAYWSRLNLDSQISTYILAARETHDPTLSGVLYDVWHKPGIRPKKLAQAESAEFVKDGLYCGQTFNVDESKGPYSFEVDGTPAEIEPGKKDNTFALRETPDMFGARLLQDITQDPAKYFARREIARTDKDLEAFEWEAYNIYQTMRLMDKSDHWFHNENQCDATFRCQYAPICWHGIDVVNGATPDGFRREVISDTPLETE